MKRLAIIALPAFLAGCMTWGGFEESLNGFVGEPLDAAVQRLGYPSGERTIAGHHLYVWSTNSTGVLMMPQYSTATATAFGSGGSATAFGTSTTYTPIAASYHCEIQMEVDISDRISHIQYNGNRGGCIRYYRMIKG